MEEAPPHLAKQFERVRKRLSPEQWQRRLDRAGECERIVLAVLREVDAGSGESKALRKVAGHVRPSTFRGWRMRYGRDGVWGLVDCRLGPNPPVPKEQRMVIETMRRANRQCQLPEIETELARHFDCPVKRSAIRNVLKQAGLSNPQGPVPGSGRAGERLEMAGLELIKAASLETGYLSSMVGAVKEHVASLLPPKEVTQEPEGVRDDKGRFVPAYNAARQGPEPTIAPAFDSVELKRPGKDPGRMKIAQVRPATLHRKLIAMLVLPVLGEGRWDGLTDPRGNFLDSICGYDYKPATLDKFTRELKYAGVSDTVMQEHARLWYEQSSRWADGGDPWRAVVIYVDATAKPLWTSKFTLSGKVSTVGRTMPCLDRIVIHTGYGVPLWMKTFSGRAGIQKHVLSMIEQMEAAIGEGMVGRITVIDAEMDSVRLFKQFDEADRGFVTILKGSMLKGDKRIFNQTNSRAYRNGDRIKEGLLDLNDPDGGQYRIRVVLVERRTKGTVTVLGTNMGVHVDLPLKTVEVAELYFSRWTNQENRFRDYNAGVHFNKNHGYGKRLVLNVSVATKADKLACRIERSQRRIEQAQQKVAEHEVRLKQERKDLRWMEQRQQVVQRHLDRATADPAHSRDNLVELVQQQRDLGAELRKQDNRVTKQQQEIHEANGKVDKYRAQQRRQQSELARLQSRLQIYASDTELDQIFSVTKLGFAMLIEYVLRTYFGGVRMELATFINHFAPLRGRRHKNASTESIIIEANPRRPDLMARLEAACAELSRRNLVRGRRRLKFKVEWPGET